MSHAIHTIDLENFSIISGRTKYIIGEYIRSLDVNQTDGSFIVTKPLEDLGVLVHYPQNPNNIDPDPEFSTSELYPINTISEIQGINPINFPLDAKFDWTRNQLWICDGANNRVILLKTSDYSLISAINDINLPYAIVPNLNIGGAYIMGFSNINTGFIYEITQNGVISSIFTFPLTFGYSILNIVRSSTWLDDLQKTSSIFFDYLRNKLWWVADSNVYMADVITKVVSTYDLASNGFVENIAINIDMNSGNAFIVSLDTLNDSYIVQINKYNSKYLGAARIENPEYASSSSSVSSSSSTIWTSLSSNP